jgi:HEAT repeat protein
MSENFSATSATQISSSEGVMSMRLLDRIALRCEQIWNERGKTAACEYANQNTNLESLREGLASGDELTRTKVVYLLSLLEPKEVALELQHVLRFDECPIVRHEAAYFIGTMHFAEATEALGRSLMEDTNELVRHESAEALGELGLQAGLPWLKKAANDPSPLVRRTIEIAERHIALKTEFRERHKTD